MMLLERQAQQRKPQVPKKQQGETPYGEALTQLGNEIFPSTPSLPLPPGGIPNAFPMPPGGIPNAYPPMDLPGLTPDPGGSLLPGGAVPEGGWGMGDTLGAGAAILNNLDTYDKLGGKREDAVAGGVTAAGTAIGAILGGGAGAGIGSTAGKLIGPYAGKMVGNWRSGKSEDQQARDKFRSWGKDAGVWDDNYERTFADGSTYNFGLDGGATYKGADGKDVHHAYEADWSNPLTGLAAGKLNPLFEQIGGDQIASNLINSAVIGATSEDQVNARIEELYKAYGSQGQGAPASPAPSAPPTNMIPRSRTRSPGIGLDGKRISY